MGTIYETGIELREGRIARASINEPGTFDDSLNVLWPTDLDEQSIVESLMDQLDLEETEVELIVGLGIVSVQDFMESEEEHLSDGSGVIRFDFGLEDNGGSVTAVRENGAIELQGVFSPNNQILAQLMIEATIIDEGINRVPDILKLAES